MLMYVYICVCIKRSSSHALWVIWVTVNLEFSTRGPVSCDQTSRGSLALKTLTEKIKITIGCSVNRCCIPSTIPVCTYIVQIYVFLYVSVYEFICCYIIYVCVCVRKYVYVCICACLCMCTCACKISVYCVCIYIYIYICVCMFMYICTYTCVHAYAYLYVYVCVYVCACVNACTYAHMCMFIYV